jgi:hypothetical protein
MLEFIDYFRFLKSDTVAIYRNLLKLVYEKGPVDETFISFYKLIKKSYNIRYWFIKMKHKERYNDLLTRIEKRIQDENND